MSPKTILSIALLFGVVAAPQLASAETVGTLDTHELPQLSSMSTDDLSDVSGGAEVANISSASIQSTVSQNSIGSIGTTGEINGNTVSNNSGITTLIANSGNQVSISQATSYFVYIH